MYVVNQQVKNGLLSGRWKKNYRFICSKWMMRTTITHFTELSQISRNYTLNDDCTVYAHIEATQPTGSVTISVSEAGGGGASAQTVSHQYGTENLESLGYHAAGTQISIIYNGSTYPIIGLTTPDLMTSSERWVEQFTIDNDTLVAESVNLDERMCSGDKLKYGLCEGSSLEFQYFNHVNIKGYRVQVFIDVDYGYSTPATIPMGYFIVEKCSRQASTGIMKATAYNKLQSDYLNQKANSLIEQAYQDGLTQDDYINNVTVNYLLAKVLEGYTIDDYQPLNYDIICNTQNSGVYDYNDEFETIEYYLCVSVMVQTNISYSNIVGGYNRVTLSDLYNFKSAIIGILGGGAYLEAPVEQLTRFRLKFKHNGSIMDYTRYPLANNEFQTPLIEDIVTNQWINEPGQPRAYLIIDIPVRHLISSTGTATDTDVANALAAFNTLGLKVERQNQSSPLGKTVVNQDIANWPDVTLRQLQSAVFESGCQFGMLDRETDLFKGVNLLTNTARLTVDPSMYSQLWADEGNVHKWRNLIITYKGIVDGQEKDIVYQKQINADGTDDYYCSDNWLFRNLVWTSDRIYYYATEMVNSMRYITWFPFELWCAGLPYMETGDKIDIPYNGNTYSSYILQRQLKGIQNLQDTYINGTLDIF